MCIRLQNEASKMRMEAWKIRDRTYAVKVKDARQIYFNWVLKQQEQFCVVMLKNKTLLRKKALT
jgi:hypothetical protein